MTTEKTPIDRALDLFVYAPLGAVLDAADVVPMLADRGRQNMAAAHMIGRFAVENELPDRLTKLEDQARHLLVELGLVPPRRPDPVTEPAVAQEPAETGPEASVEPATTARPRPTARPAKSTATRPAKGAASPKADKLAIPGYDDLAASQVIPRLSSLSAAELEAVGRYESANRGRKTILNRVAQLQSA